MMRNLLWTFAAITVMTAGQALAADKWLKKRDPEELYAYIDIHECPITTEEVTESVHSMLVRSRIKPLSEWGSGDVVLYVVLDCTSETEASWIFNQSVILAKISREGADDTVVSFRHDDLYHTFGKGGESLIDKTLNQALDAAFMKYLHANFDLAPDD